jgi:hypothetical protein
MAIGTLHGRRDRYRGASSPRACRAKLAVLADRASTQPTADRNAGQRTKPPRPGYPIRRVSAFKFLEKAAFAMQNATYLPFVESAQRNRAIDRHIRGRLRIAPVDSGSAPVPLPRRPAWQPRFGDVVLRWRFRPPSVQFHARLNPKEENRWSLRYNEQTRLAEGVFATAAIGSFVARSPGWLRIPASANEFPTQNGFVRAYGSGQKST